MLISGFLLASDCLAFGAHRAPRYNPALAGGHEANELLRLAVNSSVCVPCFVFVSYHLLISNPARFRGCKHMHTQRHSTTPSCVPRARLALYVRRAASTSGLGKAFCVALPAAGAWAHARAVRELPLRQGEWRDQAVGASCVREK